MGAILRLQVCKYNPIQCVLVEKGGNYYYEANKPVCVMAECNTLGYSDARLKVIVKDTAGTPVFEWTSLNWAGYPAIWDGVTFTTPDRSVIVYFELYGDGVKVDATTLTITITALPLSATLSASPNSGPVPLAVTFTIGIAGGVTPYSWTLDYGDGSTPGSGTVAGTKPHTYTTAGTYTATLTVTDALGASGLSRSVTYAGVLPIPDIVLLISGLAPLIAVASVVAASELQRAHVFG